MAIKSSAAALLLFGVGVGAEPPVLDRVKVGVRTEEELGLIVDGKGFDESTVVMWNGRELPTKYVSNTQVRAMGADPRGSGLAKVWARNQNAAAADPLVFIYEPSGPKAIKTRVWPNPWKAKLHGGLPVTIHGVPKGADVEIFTALGQPVKKLKAGSGKSEWTPSKTDEGLYLYQIVAKDAKRVGMIAVVK